MITCLLFSVSMNTVLASVLIEYTCTFKIVYALIQFYFKCLYCFELSSKYFLSNLCKSYVNYTKYLFVYICFNFEGELL